MKAEWEQILDDLVRFNKRHGGDCYAQWPEQRIREYAEFHIQHGTLVYFRTSGNIAGTATGWRTKENELREWTRDGRHAFHWQGSDPQGDAFFIGDVVAATPGALRELARAFRQRFPEARRLKLLTFRNGKLVELKQRLVNKLVHRKG